MFSIEDVRNQLKIMGFKQHIPDGILQNYILRLRSSGDSHDEDELQDEEKNVAKPSEEKVETKEEEVESRSWMSRKAGRTSSVPVSALSKRSAAKATEKVAEKENRSPTAFGIQRKKTPVSRGVLKKVPALNIPKKTIVSKIISARRAVDAQNQTPPKSARRLSLQRISHKPMSARAYSFRRGQHIPISKVGRTPNKCDPVNRYHQFRKAWDSTGFLSKHR